MNILFVAPVVPIPLSNGSRLVVAQLARHLAPAHKLYFVGQSRSETDESELRAHFAAVKLVKRKRLSAWQRQRVMLLDERPLWVRMDESNEFRTALRAMLAEYRIDVVHLDMGPMATYLDLFAPLPVVLAPHDSMALLLRERMNHALTRMERLVARLQYGKARRFEATYYPLAQRVVVVTERESEFLKELVPNLAVRVVPNGVDADYFAPLDVPALPHGMGFHGMMSYRENETTALEFARNELPRVRARVPDATFTIIGKHPTPALTALAGQGGVTVTGAVDDVRPSLAAQELIVVPMLTAGGIKNKLLEAMAMGKAIVTTPEGADGIAARAGQEFVVARRGDEFAAACVRLLGDAAERARLGANARAWALQHSWALAAAQYLAVYQEAIDAAAVR